MAKFIVQLRRGTKEEWETVGKDIVPLDGEIVLEYDNGVPRFKIGNNEDVYGDLSYMSADSFVLPQPISVTIKADKWEQASDDRWYQEVIVTNATITSKSKIDLQPDSNQLCTFHQKDLAFVTENENGKVLVYCVGQVPTSDYTIQATVTEVTTNEPKIIGNTTATPNPRPDWNQIDDTKADYIKNKPIGLSEFANDDNFVQDANYVHTDNNFTDVDKTKIEVNSEYAYTAFMIAQGANQAKSFGNYAEMINFFNNNLYWKIDDVEADFQVGQNIMIGTVNVPDLWIAGLPYGEDFAEYNYTNDEDFMNDMNAALATGGFLRVGYVTLGVLETQKVNLSEYVKNEDLNNFATKGRYIQTSDFDLLASPNNVYKLTSDTYVEIPNGGEDVEEYYFSVDTDAELSADGVVTPIINFSSVTPIKWNTPYQMEANAHYEIAIRGNYGVIVKFER